MQMIGKLRWSDASRYAGGLGDQPELHQATQALSDKALCYPRFHCVLSNWVAIRGEY